MVTSKKNHLPVMRPKLPTANELLPYLRRIDASRIYSNWGPLVSEFEQRLAQILDLPPRCVVSASSGMMALVGSILATVKSDPNQKPFAITPAFTFVATGLAIQRGGYSPFLADVDAKTWMLDPERLLASIDRSVLDRTSFVMPVSAFGRAVPIAPWQAFQKKTGIPVLIDGAAAFEAISDDTKQCVGNLPICVSLHATKSLGIGEGGFVATKDASLSKRVMQALNFGFYESRESLTDGTNGKLTEYGAAVGLAALDSWPSKRAAFRKVSQAYRNEFAKFGVADRFFGTGDVSACYALYLCSSADESPSVQKSLLDSDIEFRLWYGSGLHHHRHFHDLPRESLRVTDDLAPRLLGLPIAVDMSDADVNRVASAVRQGL